jgi:hypothetical protein
LARNRHRRVLSDLRGFVITVVALRRRELQITARVIFRGRFRTLAEQGDHLVGLESLAEQISVKALKFFLIADTVAAAQALIERGAKQRLGVEIAIDLFDRTTGGGFCHTGALNAAVDPQPAAAVKGHLGPGNRLSHAHIVDGPFGFQTGNCVIDVFGEMTTAEQPLPDLDFGELAPGEHGESGDVGIAPEISQTA